MASHHFRGGSPRSSWWTAVAAARPTTTTAAPAGFNLAVDPPPASVSSSTDQLSGSGFNWPSAAPDMFEAKSSRSSDESPVSISNSSITFQENQTSHTPSAMITAPLLDNHTQALDFGLSSPTIDSWTQPFFSGRGESSFHSLLQEDVMESNQVHLGIDQISSFTRSSLFLQDSGHLLMSSHSIPLLLSPLQDQLVEADQSSRSSLQRSLFYDAQPLLKNARSSSSSSSPNTNLYDNGEEALDESSALQPNSMVKLPQLIKAFAYNNRSTSSISVSEAQYHNLPSQVVLQNDNSSYSSNNNLITKASSGVVGSNLSSMEKRSGSAPAVKKAKLGAQSSLPTFKVRKEKLGDRITALQQLVSPFGKTDTASVLHEAIEYIKFLHDQVRVSSAPYLKNGHQLQQVKSMNQKTKECEGHDEDLRSRGLCLVPISSTFAVANEIPTDFWTPPAFVGSFRQINPTLRSN